MAGRDCGEVGGESRFARLGMRGLRWRGLAKAGLQLALTAIAYNLKGTLNILAAA